jgi:predicted PurR-regulated permease PerM
MVGTEIWAIIASGVAVISAVGWGVVGSQISDLVKQLITLKNEYNAAVADGTITDAEKAQITDTIFAIIQDGLSISQTIYNLVVEITKIIQSAKAKKAGATGYKGK